MRISGPDLVRIGIGIHAGAGPSTRSHPGIFFNEMERAVNVFLLRIQTASKRQLVGRVVDPMRDNGSLWHTGTKCFPNLGILLRKERIQDNAQRHPFFIEEPANPRDTPFYGVLTKALIDNIRISRSHIRPKIRAVSETPHLDIEDEADRDLFPARPRFYMNRFSRRSCHPVACIFTDCRAR